MTNKTPLYECQKKSGAQFIDFSGWSMPLHYGSHLDEHHAVRADAGIFDVSHMVVVDIEGDEAKASLQYLLANDVGQRMVDGKALYTCMLNEQGGVIDDLIVYRLNETTYRLILNAAKRDRTLAWLKTHLNERAANIDVKKDYALLAIQGPNALDKVTPVIQEMTKVDVSKLKKFHSLSAGNWFIARTGYTGEDGLEIMLPANCSEQVWQAFCHAGVTPCGLAARDTLRLEAGLNLSGSDMDESITPLEANLANTVAWEPVTRDFIGRAALEQQKCEGIKEQLVGLMMEEKCVPRREQKVLVANAEEGVITSGGFSPTLKCPIAFARLPTAIKLDEVVTLQARKHMIAARVVPLPFVRKTKNAP